MKTPTPNVPAVAAVRLPAKMTYHPIDPSSFLRENIFRQDDFISNVDNHDWTGFEGKRVLVRGCSSMLLPHWAFMYLTGKLTPFAKAIHYGNEHDNVVVFRDEQ